MAEDDIWRTFMARVRNNRKKTKLHDMLESARIKIPKEVAEALDLKVDNLVEVKIRRLEK